MATKPIFCPFYSPKPPLSSVRQARTSGAQPWTKQDDELLFHLRQQGIAWKKIAPRLSRPLAACYTRYYRFLDPFLADAVEGDAAEEEWTRSAVEASQQTLNNNSNKNKSRTENDKRSIGAPLPYAVQGPWTANDRERLEQMIKLKMPWSVIARELQRNQESCKEKWYRMQKSELEQTRHSKKIRGEQWSRLFKEGFTPHHKDQLVRAVEKHLKAKHNLKKQASSLGFLQPDDDEADQIENESSFALMMMNQGQPRQPGAIMDLPDAGVHDTEAIDWDVIAKSLNNKFPASRLRTIYYELAASKLIWTPEEDDRLIRAVVRLGPPEFQPRIWTMIKDAFDDVIRTSEDYKARWRALDMPQLEREWDPSEVKKFWRRYMEYHSPDSLLTLEPFSTDSNTTPTDSLPSQSKSEQSLAILSKMAGEQSEEVMWDLIAEGLEYRHGRDCQLYFQQVTQYFPRDPELFRHLTYQIAKMHLKPKRVYWSPESMRLLVATVNKFLLTEHLVSWNSVAKVLGNRYSTEQCEAKWRYWSQRQKEKHLTSDEDKNEGHDADADAVVDAETDSDERDDKADSAAPKDLVTTSSSQTSTKEPRLWTDRELELLHKGIQEHGLQWAKIRDNLLPHRTIQMLSERHSRDQAKKTGRFSERERSLLETAIETYGEEADWGLIASQVPGRTANQCRRNWNYARTHHVNKVGEPWTAQDQERLQRAVARFGHKWTLVSEFVVGKTPDQCRMEWRQKLDKKVKTGQWKDEEIQKMMEIIVEIVGRTETKERALLAEHHRAAKSSESPKNGQNQTVGFVDLAPRFKGKRKIDWKEVAKAMDGRTPGQCRVRFNNHRKLYMIDMAATS
ncbi:Myb-like DNA-binding domain protein [Gryganskiella cystojenkinii]|nr:Myb-like DNA-binding domain protein [Gryganskiella cystojenkinii]